VYDIVAESRFDLQIELIVARPITVNRQTAQASWRQSHSPTRVHAQNRGICLYFWFLLSSSFGFSCIFLFDSFIWNGVLWRMELRDCVCLEQYTMGATNLFVAYTISLTFSPSSFTHSPNEHLDTHMNTYTRSPLFALYPHQYIG
jgi:hypothetical protein